LSSDPFKHIYRAVIHY